MAPVGREGGVPSGLRVGGIPPLVQRSRSRPPNGEVGLSVEEQLTRCAASQLSSPTCSLERGDLCRPMVPSGFPLSHPDLSRPSWQFGAQALITPYHQSYRPLWYEGTIPSTTCLRCWSRLDPSSSSRGFSPIPSSPLQQSPLRVAAHSFGSLRLVPWLVVLRPGLCVPVPSAPFPSPTPLWIARPSPLHCFSPSSTRLSVPLGWPPSAFVAWQARSRFSRPPGTAETARCDPHHILPDPCIKSCSGIGHRDCDHVLPRSLAPPTIRTIGLAVP